MTTTISLTSKRQCVLPKDFCERKGLKPNSPLRVTEIGEGLYITPVPEPSMAEFEEVVRLTVLQALGVLGRRSTTTWNRRRTVRTLAGRSSTR